MFLIYVLFTKYDYFYCDASSLEFEFELSALKRSYLNLSVSL